MQGILAVLPDVVKNVWPVSQSGSRMIASPDVLPIVAADCHAAQKMPKNASRDKPRRAAMIRRHVTWSQKGGIPMLSTGAESGLLVTRREKRAKRRRVTNRLVTRRQNRRITRRVTNRLLAECGAVVHWLPIRRPVGYSRVASLRSRPDRSRIVADCARLRYGRAVDDEKPHAAALCASCVLVVC